MAIWKKIAQGAAGAAGGAALNVEDVFSSWLYTGNDSTTGQTIQNGIDYTDGTDRLVIVRARNDAKSSVFNDTVRGAPKNMAANSNTGENTEDVFNFASNGFTVKHTTTGTYAYCTNRGTSPSGATKYSALTFTKAEKFFTIVEYTGDGNSTKTISHDLGVSPAVVIVKNRNFGSWGCSMWTPTRRRFLLNYSGASDVASTYDEGSVTSRTSTDFTVQKYSTQGYTANRNGDSYVAYLFASNDGDGIFGETGDQDIIKVGEYTGDGTVDLSKKIDLGFEPDFLWIKCITNSGDHYWYSNPAGMGANKCSGIRYNTQNVEASNTWGVYSTGFAVGNTANDLNQKYAYVAIRRPMAVPESATEVFDAEVGGSSVANNALVTTTGFPVDMFMHFDNYASGGENFVVDRIRGRNAQVRTQYTNAEAFYSTNNPSLDSNSGLINGSGSTQNKSNGIYWSWKRAPNFFDVVAYTGTGVARTVSHNLGVAPEMMWVKSRETAAGWMIYHKDVGATKYLQFTASAPTTGSSTWNDTSPTSLDFTLGTFSFVNASGYDYIAYLFASLAGVSKVGSFSHTFGSDTNVDCGFSSGARFVLVKRYDATGNWTVWDTARGIVAGNDPRLFINSAAAENTATDAIDPYSLGFTITGNWLATGNYIFYAIA